MQKTDFPYLCVIVDDASTDGEPQLIKQYLDIYFMHPDDMSLQNDETEDFLRIVAQHKTNKNCYFVVYFLKYNHWGKKDKVSYYGEFMNNSKYIAICEGDDYWTDSNFLQKHVSFLESHPGYSMCYGRCRYYFQKTGRLSRSAYGGRATTFEELLKGNTIPTPTTMFRADLNKRYYVLFGDKEREWMMGDYSKWLFLAHEGKIHFSDDVLAVYRVLLNSASHSIDEEKSERFVYSTYSIVRYFAYYYNKPNLYDDNELKKALFLHAFKYGNRQKCVARFKDISNPPFKYWVKYIIIYNRALYQLCKGWLFYTHN